MLGAVLLVVAAAAATVAFVGYLGLAGKLPRNHFAGVRTRATLASDEAWVAAHRAAGPLLMLGGAAAVAVSLAVAPFAFAGVVPDNLAIGAVIASAAIVLAAALVSARSAVRAGRVAAP